MVHYMTGQKCLLLLARLWASIVLLAGVCRRLSSSVTLPAGGRTGRPVGELAAACAGGRAAHSPRRAISVTSLRATLC